MLICLFARSSRIHCVFYIWVPVRCSLECIGVEDVPHNDEVPCPMMWRGRSVALDTRIDVLHKQQTELESSASKHEEESEGDNSHVPEVERGLQQTCHSTAMEVVVEGIQVDEDSCHSSVGVRCPPPTMVLSRELEVQEGDGDEGCHDDEKDECNHQHAE